MEGDIAFVFQRAFALYPQYMNVRKNIGFPLLAQGVAKSEICSRVEEVAKPLRIDHIPDRPVSGSPAVTASASRSAAPSSAARCAS